MLIRFPILFVWNILRNILRLPFVCIGACIRLFSKPKPRYVHIEVHKGLLRWEKSDWRDWFRDEPVDWTLEDWKIALEKLGKRQDVLGIILDIHQLGAGLTMVHELQEWLNAFRAHDKRIILFIRHHMGMGEFALASSVDTILLQPSATVHLTAPAMQGMFFAPVLKRLGVEMAMERIGAHKNAPEAMTRAFPSPTHRQDLQELLDSVNRELYAPLAEARKMSIEELYTLFAMGVFSLEEALESGLIDGVRYADRLNAYLQDEHPVPFEYPEHPLAPETQKQIMEAKQLEEATSSSAEEGELEIEPVTEVLQSDAQNAESEEAKEDEEELIVSWDGLPSSRITWWKWIRIRKKPIIGVIPVVGNIVDQGSRNPASSEGAVRDKVIESIKEARTNNQIKAAVVYINSRGGSGYASEAIWRELRRLDAEKPVIAFLDDYAASGGYYIACGARSIISNPWCITGSIGVFGGKPVVTELIQKIQLGISGAGETPGSRFLSPLHAPTPAERERLRGQLAMFYERFILRVADNRKQTPQWVEPLAQGRVYLGTDALECGLVDACGGFDLAYQEVKKWVGLEAKDTELQFLSASPRFSLAQAMMGQASGASLPGMHLQELMAAISSFNTTHHGLHTAHSLPSLSLEVLSEYQMLAQSVERGGVAAWLDSRLIYS